MYDGPIIDAHHHIWHVRDYPWLTTAPTPRLIGSDYGSLNHDYLLDDLLADFGDNKVIKTVHMQAHWHGDPVDETAWLQSIADERGYPHGITGYAPLADPKVADMLDRHMKFANFRGVRDVQYFMPGEKVYQAVSRPDFCLSPEWRRGVQALADRDLICELQGFYSQFRFFAELVAEFPRMRFALTHGGLPYRDDDAYFAEWRDALAVLAKQPNVHVKCSGTNTFTRGKAPRAAHFIGRQYNTILDLFGAKRCYYSSNHPVEGLHISYDNLVAIVKAAVFHRPAEEQRAFFHDTAAAFYRI